MSWQCYIIEINHGLLTVSCYKSYLISDDRDCLATLAPFFWGPAILIGLIYAIGVPTLFCLLTRTSSLEYSNIHVDTLLDYYYPKKLKQVINQESKRNTRRIIAKFLCRKQKNEESTMVRPVLEDKDFEEPIKKPPKKVNRKAIAAKRWEIRTGKLFTDELTNISNQSSTC